MFGGQAVSRRRLLLASAGVLGGGLAVADRVRGQSPEDRRFDPRQYGFGFRNWTARDQYFETPPDPTPEAVRERIRTDWREQSTAILGADPSQWPNRLVDAIASHLRLAVVHRAGTNGHCYGMVLSAQRYFERPDTIPVDRPTASEIEDPTVPVDAPEAPVYDDIVQRQAEQYLRFRAWLGRRAMFHPSWIDTDRVVADIQAVINAFGTAGLTLFNESIYSHQVLAYRLETDGRTVRIPIYDPNRPAVVYDGPTRPALTFLREDGSLRFEGYDRYTHLLFNRYDRIERATGRDDASPLDHLAVDSATLKDSLFPLTVVLVDSEDVELGVVGTDGDELERVRGVNMDPSRDGYARVRTQYGTDPGDYRVTVYGTDSTDYKLRVLAAEPDGVIVDGSWSETIGAGDLHEYELAVPTTGDGRVRRATGVIETGLTGGVGAAGGVVLGALGFRALRNRRG